MKTRTASLVAQAPRERLFAYLSNVEHLPQWATDFCRELKVVDGKHKVVSPMGELFFRIEADEWTGVIDMFAGPTEDRLAIFPTRVVALPGGSSAFIMTMFRWPGMTDQEFQGQYEALQREFRNIEAIVTGGEAA
jgi:hypothetical protein